MAASVDPNATTGALLRGFARDFAAGDVIYEPGEAGEVLFVIQAGEVELQRPGLGDAHLLACLGRGEFFGEMSVLVGSERLERAVARRDTQLIEIDASTFQEMCVDQPEIAIRVIRRIASRVQELERRLSALGADDLLRPVVRVLLRSPDTGDPEAYPGRSLRALADAAGLSLLETHQALSMLLEQRLVRLADDKLQVPDLDALASALEDDAAR